MDKGKNVRVEQRDALKERRRGELIAAIRKKLGYSQEELEWRSGVSRTQISRIERDITNPTIETIQKLEKALDVPLMDLFHDADSVDREHLLRKAKPESVLTKLERKLANGTVSPKELQQILNYALAEDDSKKGDEAKNQTSGPGQSSDTGQDSS